MEPQWEPSTHQAGFHNMAKKKSPFGGYTIEEVRRMENGFFLVQMGGDFLAEDGHYLFTRKEAIKLYNSTYNDLIKIINDGNDKDRAYSTELILGLMVQRMVLH